MTQLQVPLLAQRRPSRRPLVEGEDRKIVYYEGLRIYFRPVEVEDEPALRRWINDPSIWRGLPLRGPINANREREWIESQSGSTSDHIFGIVVRDGDRLIGTIGLRGIDPVARSATLGIAIGDRTFHSKGYGTEAVRLLLRYAFDELNLNRVALAVFAKQPASDPVLSEGRIRSRGVLEAGTLSERRVPRRVPVRHSARGVEDRVQARGGRCRVRESLERFAFVQRRTASLSLSGGGHVAGGSRAAGGRTAATTGYDGRGSRRALRCTARCPPDRAGGPAR